jgi:hypothetical protein
MKWLSSCAIGRPDPEFRAGYAHFALGWRISSHRGSARARCGHHGSIETYLPEPTMIAQILSHTPVYVWALLAFLLYRGYLASQDRELSLLKLAIIPGVMLVLALTSINPHGALGEAVWAAWAAGVVVAVALVWTLSKGEIAVNRAAGTVVQRGSWAPLMLMFAIFVTKYSVGVLTAIRPDLMHAVPASLGVTVLYGLFNGVFIGRLARYAAAYLRQPLSVAAL